PATTAAMNPEISVVADFALAAFSDEAPLQSGAHDPTENGFNLQQMEVSMRASVDPYLRFDAFLVFGLFGVELEEATGTTLDLPAGLQLRFGQFASRFGRINATHPHSWDFADQPFALGRIFGAEGQRGLGVELSWLTPLPWHVELVTSVSDAEGEDRNRSFLGAEDRRTEGPADLLWVAAAKQFFSLSDAWSLLWGTSAAFGPNASGRDNRTEVYGVDFFLKYRPLAGARYTQVRWQTEVFHRRRQVPDNVVWDVSGYTQTAWRFARRWESAGRYELGSTPFDLDGRRVIDPLDPQWDGMRHRFSASLSHFPTEFSRFRLQGSADLPDFRDSPIYAAFLTAELVAGAHGAHTF
ncbi:MAG TPA: hypothetical protein PKA88_33045, partial [Polyangiaceae bacterium]|nr:hypothetical protein [Polyangiaceae bacterium]